MLTDSHCHLFSDAFDEDRSEVLARMVEAGVERAVVVASDARESGRIADWLSSREASGRPRLFGTAGIHPHAADTATPDALATVADLLDAGGVTVAVGECGLDFHYDNSPREAQHDAFRAQVELADRTGLPLVVHSRDAEPETIGVLRELPDGVRGVLHCFTGTRELLDAVLAAGWHVSFSGIVTFRSWADAELVRAVPDDRLLIETDSPYLAPVPKRGKRNEPSNVRHVCEVVAEMRDTPPERIAEVTARNAATLFGLPEPGSPA